jgi:hypothetical protein
MMYVRGGRRTSSGGEAVSVRLKNIIEQQLKDFSVFREDVSWQWMEIRARVLAVGSERRERLGGGIDGSVTLKHAN